VTAPSSPVAARWKRFLLVTFPVALIVVAVVLEVLAAALSGVTPRRHTVDDLVAAVATDPADPPVVLLGDSVVHNITRIWKVGEPGTVADISSHGDAGLVAELLLLRRFIAAGHHPRRVLLIASPDVYAIEILPAGFSLYVDSTFTHADEKALLRQLYPQFVSNGWRPAALQVDHKIAAPLFSLLRNTPAALPVGDQVPNPRAAPESLPANEFDPAMAAERTGSSLSLLAAPRQIMHDLCALSLSDGFTLDVAMPPTAPEILAVWRKTGALARFTAEMTGILSHDCHAGPLLQLGASHSYANFDRSSRHIRGSADEQAFASEIATLIAERAAPER
jgi:hypothetical protein